MRNFNAIIQYFTSTAPGRSVLSLAILTIGLFTAIILVNQRQDIRQRAQFASTLASCLDCNNIGLNNPFLCRATGGQLICQPKDVSDAFPGMVCVECKTLIEKESETEKNPIKAWWNTVVSALNPDLNRDGKINLGDFKEILGLFKSRE